MKFCLLLTLSLCICLIECQKKNLYNGYITGLLRSLLLKSDHMNECMPTDWRMENAKDHMQFGNELLNAKTALEPLLKIIDGKAIDEKCANKKEMIDYFVEKKNVDQSKKNPRFIQMVIKNLQPDNSQQNDKNGKNEKKDRKLKEKNLNNNNTPGKNAKYGKLITKKFGPFDDLYSHIPKVMETLKTIVNTPMMATTIKFLDCYKNAKDVSSSGIFINI